MFKGGKKHKKKNKVFKCKNKEVLSEKQMQQLLTQFKINSQNKVEFLGYVDREY